VTGESGKTYVLVSFINNSPGENAADEGVHEALVDWIQDAL
jgi:hypothetical protein